MISPCCSTRLQAPSRCGSPGRVAGSRPYFRSIRMHDEPDRHEVDAPVRAALTPQPDAGRRVAARALTIGQAIPPQPWRRRRAMAMAALLAVLVVAGVWWSRAVRRAASPPLSIT